MTLMYYHLALMNIYVYTKRSTFINNDAEMLFKNILNNTNWWYTFEVFVFNISLLGL